MAEPAPAAALDFDAVILDLDGVVTRTATLHAAAWKEVFDHLLRARAAEGDAAFRPFDPEADYQSAATAMATAQRAGVENIGLVEP